MNLAAYTDEELMQIAGQGPPGEAMGDLSGYSDEELMRIAGEQKTVSPESETPEWAGEYPNLYGAYGAGRELLRTGIESGATTLGAAGGTALPVPGASLVGAGVGYAGGKRMASAILGEPVEMEPWGVGKDILLGGALQGVANVVGKIPYVKNILSPKAAAVGPQRTVGSEAIDKTAYAMMEKSMKVPPSVKAPIRERAITTALEEGIPITKGGLARTKTILEDLTNQMDETIAQSAMKDNPINIDDVLGPVTELRNWVEQTVTGSKLTKRLDKVVNDFRTQYGDVITVEQAQTIKQNTNAFLKKAYGELKPVETEATKQIVRGLKDRIAAEIPEIVGKNIKYGDMKTLETALERAVNRTGNWDWFSLSAGIAGTITGGATGSMLKATEAVGLWRVLKSPVVQSRLAIALKHLGKGSQANMLANTVTQAVFNKMTGRNKPLTGETREF